jgi:hypothetical protein
LAAPSAKGDPLEAIDRLVPWESFRADIEAVVLTPDEMRKSSAGRKPVDAIVMGGLVTLLPILAHKMQQLLSACGLCANVTGIRSR